MCLAEGVALNCVGNGKIVSKKIFDKVWIQPAAGDAGGALGDCIKSYYYNVLNKKRYIDNSKLDSMEGSYLGPSFQSNEMRRNIY